MCVYVCICVYIYGIAGQFAYSAYSQSFAWRFIDCLNIFTSNSRSLQVRSATLLVRRVLDTVSNNFSYKLVTRSTARGSVARSPPPPPRWPAGATDSRVTTRARRDTLCSARDDRETDEMQTEAEGIRRGKERTSTVTFRLRSTHSPSTWHVQVWIQLGSGPSHELIFVQHASLLGVCL